MPDENRIAVRDAIIKLMMDENLTNIVYYGAHEDRSGLTNLKTSGCGCCAMYLEGALIRMTGLTPQKLEKVILDELTAEDIRAIDIAFIKARMKELGLTAQDVV
jgi:hypothetical protein